MTSFTNDTKNTTALINDAFGAGQLLGDSEGTLEDNEVALERGIGFENDTKNTTALTNDTKN